MEDICESNLDSRQSDIAENGELESNSVNENGLEVINEQPFRESTSGRSASGIGSINGDEKPELSDVFDMVCIYLFSWSN